MVELVVEASFDLTTLSLVDPGHVAFVHDSWWFRPSKGLREKVKTFQPVAHGFTMTSHATTTSSPVYRLLGGVPEVEIEFRLPGARLERIRAGARRVANYTFATPLSADRTMLTNALYWRSSVCGAPRPGPVKVPLTLTYVVLSSGKPNAIKTPSADATLLHRSP